MNSTRIFVFAFLTVACGQLSAGEPAADYSISVDVAPGGVMPPGSEGVVTINITNQGPDEWTPLFGMRGTDDGTGFFSFPPINFEFPGAFVSGPCVTAPIQLPPVVEFLNWLVLDMPAGESVECRYAFTVAETSVVSRIGRWAVVPYVGPDDPNDANNVADVLLRFAEPSEPVSVPVLPPWALLILVLMLGPIGVCGLAGHSNSPLSSGR